MILQLCKKLIWVKAIRQLCDIFATLLLSLTLFQNKKLKNKDHGDTKVNSKRIKDLTIRVKSITFKKKIECESVWSGNNGFLAMTPEAEATKQKTDKLYFIKIKAFCVSKDTIPSRKWKENPWNGRIYLKITYLKINLDLAYTKNSFLIITKDNPNKIR